MSKFKNTEELEKAYQELEREFTKKSQKLAESEKEIKFYANRNVELIDESLNLRRANNQYFDENKQLKQQLAEKEKEIEELIELNQVLQFRKNQDKISFCIEKFQETKKSLRDKVCLMENDEHCYPQNAIHWQDVVAIIDNQIASLKKGVE